MKNGGWVRWRHWTANGMVAFGQMPLRDVGRELQKFEAEAIKILKETGADHVLYGVKEYDGDGIWIRYASIWSRCRSRSLRIAL